MILCKLIGGLGNQMFSYAIGRSLSLDNDGELLVDLDWVHTMSRDKNIDLLGLKYFELWSSMKRREGYDVFRKYDSPLFSKIVSRLDLVIPYKHKKIIFEKRYNFEPRVFSCKSKDLYLKRGYWQSYKYFEKYNTELRQDFRFRKFVIQECKNSASRIQEHENSVSIHIRRGDYVNKPEIAKVHGGICTINYYLKAIEFLEEKLLNPQFFVFSDDLMWAKNELPPKKNIHFVEHDIDEGISQIGHKDNGYKDMYLMSICKHNIIANSSFSWWAAWLNSNTSKIVVVPPKWFNDERDTRDLIPKDWIKLIPEI